MNKDQKIEAWAEREMQRNLPKMIIQSSPRGWLAFGKYHILATDHGYLVQTQSNDIHEFASKKAAISYCIADNNNKINLAQRIMVLDTKQQLLGNDIRCRQAQCNRARTQNFYDTVDAKVQPTIARYQAITDELEKCVNMAKYIQIRGFHNETARTSGV